MTYDLQIKVIKLIYQITIISSFFFVGNNMSFNFFFNLNLIKNKNNCLKI